MQIVELVSKVISEANSAAGTWSLAVIRLMQQAKEKFTEEQIHAFFENIIPNVTINCQPVTIYKWAQLFSFMHFSKFPGFEKFYQEKGRKIKSIIDTFQAHPLGQAAKGLVEKIPLSEPMKLANLLPISQSKSHHFLVQKNDVQKNRKDRITCCSPPPFRAL